MDSQSAAWGTDHWQQPDQNGQATERIRKMLRVRPGSGSITGAYPDECALHRTSRARLLENIIAMIRTDVPHQWRVLCKSWLLRGGKHRSMRWLDNERNIRTS